MQLATKMHKKTQKVQLSNRLHPPILFVSFRAFSWQFYLLVVFWVSVAVLKCAAAGSAPPDFTKNVAPIFAKYCSGCHNDSDLEGKLSLESFAKLQKGGEKGAVVVPNRSDASLMIRMLTGEVEPAMPPKDNPQPTEAQINV